MSKDLIQILLDAKIDQGSVNNIKAQLKEIEKQAGTIHIDIDTKSMKQTTAEFQNTHKQLQSITQNKIKIFDEAALNKSSADFIKITGTLEGSMRHLENRYKELGKVTISGQQFDAVTEGVNKFTLNVEKSEGVVKKYGYSLQELTTGQQIWLRDKISGSDKSADIEAKNLKQMHDVREAIKRTTQAEKERNKALYERMDLYKNKMLGDGDFKGELDIFASKNKGQFNEDALAKIRRDVEDLDSKTPNLNNKMKELNNQFGSLKKSAEESGGVMQNALINAGKFLRFYLVGGILVGFTRSIKDGITSIKELDTALVELKKVTSEADQTYKDFTNTAFELGKGLGRTGTEVIEATADFARMGFTLKESTILAQEALLMLNVGDGIDSLDTATTSIIATLKGFRVEGENTAESTRRINDVYNEIANNFATSTGALAEGVRRTSAVMNQAGNSFDETVSMFTGAYEVIQDSSKVSSGLNIITQRLKAMDMEGGKIEGLAPKLEKAFNDIGLSLYDTNGELKSTFDNLQALSAIYPTLTKEQQNYINELVSGKRQAVVLESILSNWESVEGAMISATEATGSAMAENEKYLDSIEGRTATLASSGQMFWKNFIDPDMIKVTISSLTTIVDISDKIINNSFSKFLLQLGLITGGIALANKAMVLFSTSVGGTALGVAALNIQTFILGTTSLRLSTILGILTSAMWASPLFMGAAAVALVMGIVKAVKHFTVTLEEQKEKVESLTSSISELQSEYRQLADMENKTEEQERYLDLLSAEIANKKELLEIESQRAIQQEFFDRKVTKDGASSNLSEDLLNDIETIKALRHEITELDSVDAIKKKEEEIAKLSETLIGHGKTLSDHISLVGNGATPQQLKLRDAIQEVVVVIDELDDKTSNLNDAQIDQSETLGELSEKFDNVTSAIKVYGDFLDELNSKEGLSAEAKQEIISKYPELIGFLTDEEAMRFALIEAIETEKEEQANLFYAKIEMSEDFINARVDGEKTMRDKLAEYYGIDLDRAKDLAVAKAKVEEKLLKELTAAWGKYYNAQSQSFTADYNTLETLVQQGGMSPWAEREMNQFQGALSNYRNLADNFRDVTLDFAGINFDGINMSDKQKAARDKKGAKTKKGSTAKTKEEYKAEADAYAKINLELDRNNVLLARNKTMQDLAGDDIAKKIELMKEQVKLEGDHQKLLHDKANLYRDELKELEKSLSGEGFKFKGSGDNRIIDNLDNIKGKTKEVEEDFKRYVDIQSKEIPGLQQLWWNLEKSITDVGISMEDSIRKAVKEMIELERDNAYMELEVRLSIAKGELEKLRTEMQSAVDGIEVNISGLQSEIDAIQESERLRSENIERARRLSEISELQNKYYHLQYTNLANMTEAQAKLVGLEKEREQHLERQVKLQELQIKLTNLQNEKNIQQLKKMSDGTWEFEYVADQKAIDDVNKQVENLQKEHDKTLKNLKEQTLDSLQKAQKDYDEWERQNSIQATIREKQARIKRYQDEIKDMQDQFKEKEDEMNEQFEKEKEALDAHYKDIDELTDIALEKLHETFSEGYGGIYEEISGYMSGLMSEHMALVAALETQIVIPAPIYAKGNESGGITFGGGGGGSGGGGSNYGKGSATGQASIDNDNRLKSDKAFRESELSRTQDVIRNRQNAGMDTSSQEKYLDKLIKGSYAQGGKITETGTFLANFHGKESSPEWIFNDAQLQKVLKSAVLSTISMAAPKIPQLALSGSSGETKQNVTIREMVFPNVHDAREIESSVKSLSTYANQWANQK